MELCAMVAVRSHESLNFDLLLDFITHHEKYWDAAFTQAPKSQNLFIKIYFFQIRVLDRIMHHWKYHMTHFTQSKIQYKQFHPKSRSIQMYLVFSEHLNFTFFTIWKCWLSQRYPLKKMDCNRIHSMTWLPLCL